MDTVNSVQMPYAWSTRDIRLRRSSRMRKHKTVLLTRTVDCICVTTFCSWTDRNVKIALWALCRQTGKQTSRVSEKHTVLSNVKYCCIDSLGTNLYAQFWCCCRNSYGEKRSAFIIFIFFAATWLILLLIQVNNYLFIISAFWDYIILICKFFYLKFLRNI